MRYTQRKQVETSFYRRESDWTGVGSIGELMLAQRIQQIRGLLRAENIAACLTDVIV